MSGHGHVSATPPCASMLSQGGKEAAGSKPVLDAGPAGSPAQGSRLLPARGLACSIFTGLQGYRAGAGPQQKPLTMATRAAEGALGGRGTLSSPRVVPGGSPRTGNGESPWARDGASLPPVSWSDCGTPEGIDVLPRAKGSSGHP